MDCFPTSSGVDVLVVGLEGGKVKAFQSHCPHQDIELVEGEFDGKVLTCRAHLWQFDCHSGKGINPDDCHISEYPVKIDGEDIYVDIEGIEPFQSHS